MTVTQTDQTAGNTWHTIPEKAAPQPKLPKQPTVRDTARKLPRNLNRLPNSLQAEAEAEGRSRLLRLRAALAHNNPNHTKDIPSPKLLCQVKRDNEFLMGVLGETGRVEEREYVLAYLHHLVRKRVERSLSGARGTTAAEEQQEKQLQKARAEAEAGTNVQPEVNKRLAEAERKSATRLYASRSDNLQNVDINEMTEHSLGDALADLWDPSVPKDATRLITSQVSALAYNGFRRYLRRTRFDRHYDDLAIVDGETDPAVWLLDQVAYEAEVIPAEVRLADILKAAKKEFSRKHKLHQTATTAKGKERATVHNAKVKRLWERAEAFIILSFWDQQPQTRQGSAQEKQGQRAKAMLRELVANSPSLQEAIS